MLLSACIIVKNEQWTLRKCLESLQDVADEIIVVDTGSTDRTVEIARSLGAKVFSYEWDNNFANARNYSLDQAQGDFILYIDADEYLDPAQKHAIRPLLEQTDAEGVIVTVRNYVGTLSHVSTAIPIVVMRIFRRGHRFSGAVHEQISGSVMAAGRPVAKLDLTIHHLGYIEDLVAARHKSDRNIQLLESELEKNPSDFFHLTNLMAEHIRVGQFQECAKLAEDTFREVRRSPFGEWPHYISRLAIFLVTSMWQIGEKKKAMDYAVQFIGYYPWLTDLKKRYAAMLIQESRWAEAVPLLMECRAQGDPKDAYIDTVEGMGTYFAAADLGVAWTALGDDLLARRWYLQAFMENPQMQFMVLPLVYLMPPDEALLRDRLESRIRDVHTYGNYAEMYALAGHPGAEGVVSRAEAAFGRTDMTRRARMVILLRQNPEALRDFVEDDPCEENWLRLGIHLRNAGHRAEAHEVWARAGARGEFARMTDDLIAPSSNARVELLALVRDLVCMNAMSLLRAWLPQAVDRAELWPYLRHSPAHALLAEIEWPGDTVQECEQNALRLFRSGNLAEADGWIQKAEAFTPTVTKILVAADLALARRQLARALSLVSNGLHYFPESEALANVAKALAGAPTDADSRPAETPETTEEDATHVNPYDAYRAKVVDTMPLNVQFAQLHERGMMITRQAHADAQSGNIPSLRDQLAQIQEILTYLRSSLDLRLEVARVTDQTYAYFYAMTVKWFVEPRRILEENAEYEAMLNFWESWARTWSAVKSG